MPKKSTSQEDGLGHWYFSGELDPEKAFGFVYIIRNKSTNQKYIGKKFFRGTGKKNAGKQSNWKVYQSSSGTLKQDIKEFGKENFEFIILEQYYTRGGLSWAEIWSQVFVEIPSNNDQWYNRFIDKVTWKSTESITDRHKRTLKRFI